MPSTRVATEKYKLLEELGRGGFATVYKALDLVLDRVVALKVLHVNPADSSDVVQRFVAEARRAANLRHDGIVRIYEVGDYHGHPYIAMEYLPGGTLSARLNGEPLSIDAALTILERVADALDFAHKRNLVHRDVKPANILFDDEGRAVLADFGLVKSLVESGLTVDGTSLGTPHYMAPEQAQVGGLVDARADVYALGVVVYEMLTGRAPFQFDTPLAVMRAHLDVTPPDPRQFNAVLDDAVVAVMLKALAKLPNERYDSAYAFARALREAWQVAQHVNQTRATLADLYAQTQLVMKAGQWGALVNLCVEILNLDPNYRDVSTLLALAASRLAEEEQKREQERVIIEQYNAALELLDTGRFADAVEVLDPIAKQMPDFRDVQVRLVAAREELQRAKWYDEAIVLGEEGQLVEACQTWIKVLRGGFDYRKGDASLRFLEASEKMISQLNSVFGQQRRDLAEAREALRLYEGIVAAVESQDWRQVIALGGRLLAFDPNVKHVMEWLSRARRESGLAEVHGQDRLVWNADGKTMMRIPAGEFSYGDEKQQIMLADFYIDQTPVTNEEYARFTAESGRGVPEYWKSKKPPADLAKHPVVYVSWYEASSYARWAGKRLPSEQEWEKAARGTDCRIYPWGDQEPTAQLCNFDRNVGSTSQVGRYSPHGDSQYGCVDMIGNVWEWTSSDHGNNRKVLRGGSWIDEKTRVRASARLSVKPDSQYEMVGFRCAVAVSDSAR